MALAAGTPVPAFSLARGDGAPRFTHDDLRGRTTVLVFYPFAFSPVCTDQLQVYDQVLEDFEERGVTLDRKSTRLNSSHANISYAVFCLKKKNKTDKCYF